ncbi:transposable element Tcb2 transposase [Trichonephila clavipes]|uniref:Transposable element Tcb2 transposase n=1 Tax=Trichonephila clavipes TaxID=2585209 RepID=A0A8X6R9J7_TRICX|nr:transposable element Tcb2 transposase [Trichonephila clavipes]
MKSTVMAERFNCLGRYHLDRRTPLQVFERCSLTDLKYRHEVLEPRVRLFMGACGPEFILMDDNTRPHRALLVAKFLESADIRHIDCTTRSLDLNPIEHVKRYGGGNCNSHATPSENTHTIQETKTALLNE